MQRRRKITARVLAMCLAGSLAAGNAAYGAPDVERQAPEDDRSLGAADDGDAVWSGSGTTYYVDADEGDDSHEGTAAQPFKTIQYAVDRMQAGDTCIVREGVYSEEVKIEKDGEEEQPITLRNYPGETVVISGCDQLTGWTDDVSRPGEGIYKTSMKWSMGHDPELNIDDKTGIHMGGDPGDMNQLFVNGEVMYEARYPNVEEGRSLTNLNYAKTGTGTGFVDGSKAESKLVDPALKDMAEDFFDGAKIWMVPGSQWTSLTTYADRYDPATGTVIYPSAYRAKLKTYYAPGAGKPYYIFGTHALLDAEKEWWYDRENQEVYVKIPGGKNPDEAGAYVEAKARVNAFDLSGASYINIEGINMRGATLITDEESSHILLKDMKGEYVSHCSSVELNDAVYNTNTQENVGVLLKGSFIEVNGCEFSNSSGPILNMQGSDNKLINSYIHDGNYIGTYAGHTKLSGRRQFISNNTLCESGRDVVSFRQLAESVIQYNDVYGAGRLTLDLGLMYTAETDGQNTLIHHNVVHDNYSKSNPVGIYLDEMSNNFIEFNNVSYNTNGYSFQCNQPSMYNLVYNNTGYNKNSFAGGYQQSFADTRGRQFLNNMFNKGDSGAFLPASEFSLANIDEMDMFTDTGAADFRLKDGSKGIGAGIPIKGVTPDGVTNPSVGAYQQDEELFEYGHNFENPPEIKEAPEVTQFEYRNLIKNGGFEYGTLEGWSGEANVEEDPSWHSNNKKSATCFYGLSLQEGNEISQSVVVEPYTQYTVGLMARASVSEGNILISVGENKLDEAVRAGTWGGKQKFLTFTTENETEVTLTIENNGENVFYLDDIGMQKDVMTIRDLSKPITLENTEVGCTVSFDVLQDGHAYYYSDNRESDKTIKKGGVQIPKPIEYSMKLEDGMSIPWSIGEYLNVVEAVGGNIVGFGSVRKNGNTEIKQIVAVNDTTIRGGAYGDKVLNTIIEDDQLTPDDTLYLINLNSSNSSDYVRKGYLQFDLSDLDLDRINGAKLKFYIYETNPDEGTSEGAGFKRGIIVSGVEGEEWNEDTLTWNNAKNIIGKTKSLGKINDIYTVKRPNGKYCELDITDYIHEKAEGGKATVQLEIDGIYAKGNIYIATKENPYYADRKYHPQLEIEYASAALPVTGVELDQTELALEAGDHAALKAAVKPIDSANRKVSWGSSDESVAVVDENGRVTALRDGTAVITVTTEDGGFTADCTVIVGEGVIKNPVTVERGVIKAIDATPSDAVYELVPKGSTVTIQAEEAAVDEKFIGWRAVPETVKLKDAKAEKTTFIAPDSPVTVIAEYANAATPSNARAISKAVPENWYAMAKTDSLNDLLNDDEIITEEDAEKLEKGWDVEVVLEIKKQDKTYKATPADAVRAEVTEEEAIGFFAKMALKKTIDWKGSQKRSVTLDEAVNPVEVCFAVPDDLTGKENYRVIGIAAGEEEAEEYDFSWDETGRIVSFTGEVNGIYALVYDTSIPWTPIDPADPVDPDDPDEEIPWIPIEPSKPIEPEKPSRGSGHSSYTKPADKWNTDKNGWKYLKNGSYVTSSWEFINWNGRQDWYYFGADGYMLKGWYLDQDGNWYYLNPNTDGTGGSMLTGWQLIDGKWYFFKEVSDGTRGALLTNTVTPDGCFVGSDGAWIER